MKTDRSIRFIVPHDSVLLKNDRNNFLSYENLYKVMKQMDYSTYLNYLNAAELFIKDRSDK